MKLNTTTSRQVIAILLLALNTISLSALAGSGTDEQASHELKQVFTVENMTCATCPITVKTAMKRLNGVVEVAVDLDSETATVVYIPALVSVEAIAAASTDVGFPASVLE